VSDKGVLSEAKQRPQRWLAVAMVVTVTVIMTIRLSDGKRRPIDSHTFIYKKTIHLKAWKINAVLFYKIANVQPGVEQFSSAVS
jgi:hypothetical protein